MEPWLRALPGLHPRITRPVSSEHGACSAVLADAAIGVLLTGRDVLEGLDLPAGTWLVVPEGEGV